MKDLLEMMPPDTPEVMTHAWVDCLRWAIGESEIIQRFSQDTGVAVKRPTSVLDRMIDQAAGMDQVIVEKFVAWFNENVWGSIDGPDEDAIKGHAQK